MLYELFELPMIKFFSYNLTVCPEVPAGDTKGEEEVVVAEKEEEAKVTAEDEGAAEEADEAAPAGAAAPVGPRLAPVSEKLGKIALPDFLKPAPIQQDAYASCCSH